MLSKSRLKYIQTLGQKKFRDSERLFIAEGPKVVKDLLEEVDTVVREVFGLPDWIEGHRSYARSTIMTEVTEEELGRMSQLTTPNQVVALVEQFPHLELKAEKEAITLVLDEIQDPGNLGTLVRLADWFGISNMICSHGSADIYNPKVVQSTMGSIARVRVMYADLEQWLWQQEGINVYAAVLDGQDVSAFKKITEGILLIGNESRGINNSLLKLADTKITITKKGKAESLNAAVATGIILSHMISS